MDSQLYEFGKRVKTRRKQLDMKQEELAEILDISSNHLSSVENGKSAPSFKLLCDLISVLNVNADYLFSGVIHSNSVPSNIIDMLNQCSQNDLELIQIIVYYMMCERKNIKQFPDFTFIDNVD